MTKIEVAFFLCLWLATSEGKKYKAALHIRGNYPKEAQHKISSLLREAGLSHIVAL